MQMLLIGTHGSESPTHAILPFLNAQGALEAGHQAELLLVGDAVVLLRDEVAQSTVGVGWPAVAEVFAALIDHAVPVHVWGGCAVARGVTEADLEGKHARFITPRIAAELVAAADKVVTF